MKTTSTTKLRRQIDGEIFTFGYEHAQRILRIKNSGWEIIPTEQKQAKK